MNPRLRAVFDLAVPAVRENAGRHEYDGVVQDLAPAGVAAALARVGDGPRLDDVHDEAHLAAFEAGLRAHFATAEEHRRNPLVHIDNLDLSVYEREYAPAGERTNARRRHLAGWPAAVDAALDALDRVPRELAQGLLGAARGLAADVAPGDDVGDAALAAHARLVAHLEHAAAHGEGELPLGTATFERLIGDPEATAVDAGRLAERADRERDRLRSLLADACGTIAPGAPPAEVIAGLLRDHPSTPEEIYDEARAQIAEVTAFTLERDLLPDPGGECLVGPAPPARRWAMAMMSWAAPNEDDAPSWYHVTPPDPAWPADEQEEWLQVFSRTTLPAITVHEVTPGHYAHGRMLRRVRSYVRRSLMSSAFIEGWAHYAEELFVEEVFRRDDPRFVIGVAVEALVRVTRLAVATGIHTGAMTMAEAVRRFEDDAFLAGPAARAEANRAGYDPTYGRYTWGKLEIMGLRDEARAQWGRRYSHRRFHEALLALGAPPLGLMDAALRA